MLGPNLLSLGMERSAFSESFFCVTLARQLFLTAAV